MAKMNYLTRQTRAQWAGAARRDKIGDITRSHQRAEQWARWKAEQLGIVIPYGSLTRVGIEAVRFVPPKGDYVSISLPDHCRATHDVSKWERGRRA